MEERKPQERHEAHPDESTQTERVEEAPEQTTGGTGTLPSEGIPNPGFTTRGG